MNHEVLHNFECVKEYVREKLKDGTEPPWAWYQYMKLMEAVEFIISGNPPCIPSTTECIAAVKPSLTVVKP